MFRNSDHDDEVPELETNPTVKIEPSSEEATSGQEDKLVSDQESQEKKVHFSVAETEKKERLDSEKSCSL